MSVRLTALYLQRDLIGHFARRGIVPLALNVVIGQRYQEVVAIAVFDQSGGGVILEDIQGKGGGGDSLLIDSRLIGKHLRNLDE